MIYEVSRDGDTSSSCSECKREHQEGESSPHSHHHDRSSEEEGPIPPTEPLSPQRSNQQKHLIRILQDENRRLKLINEDQERQLKDLKFQLQLSKTRPYAPELISSSKDLKRIKLQGQITPKGMMRMMSPELRSKTDFGDSLQKVLLEKQIKQFQLKLLQMSNKLKEYEENCIWMQKFIISFASMAEDLSLNYGSKIQTRGLNLRKRTKVCWRYMKELINYLIK